MSQNISRKSFLVFPELCIGEMPNFFINLLPESCGGEKTSGAVVVVVVTNGAQRIRNLIEERTS